MSKYFVYTRKSTETEDKQVLSLESQANELNSFIKKEKLEVVEILPGESKSAKQPGRPIFDQMLKRIGKGEADGIIAWHPDRLARNSIDGGQIVYLLDQEKLKDLKFPTYSFENSPQGKFFLNMMFGQSKYYVDSLTENIRRGNKTKLEKGWLPGIPPLGYINDRENHTIIEDPDRFRIVRKLWDTLLTGSYSVPEIQEIANNEWGLRTRKFKRRGDKKLNLSNIYDLFGNPFYYGAIRRAGEIYQGAHKPMITINEFNNAQEILGREGRPQPKKYEFAFTGMIRCGECGSMITAEQKTKPSGKKYTYYRCTKRKKGAVCSQKCTRDLDLNKQIAGILDKIKASDKFRDWAIDFLRKRSSEEIEDRQKIYQAQQKAYNDCQNQLDELTQLRLKNMVGDSEYASVKEKLFNERARLKEKLTDTEGRATKWLELSEKVFLFANQAKKQFENGSLKEKREILQNLGSNFVLKDGKLHIQLEKPYRILFENTKNLVWWSIAERIRTFFINLDGDFHIPDLLTPLIAKPVLID